MLQSKALSLTLPATRRMRQAEHITVTASTFPVLASSHFLLDSMTGSNRVSCLGWAIVFAGKDASRALGMSSTKAVDVRPDWSDLNDKEKGVLDEWFTFFSKRYQVVGRVAGASNL